MKYDPDGSIEKYKTRPLAQRFSQIYEFDYTITFIPTIRRKSLRIFLTITAMLDIILI